MPVELDPRPLDEFEHPKKVLDYKMVVLGKLFKRSRFTHPTESVFILRSAPSSQADRSGGPRYGSTSSSHRRNPCPMPITPKFPHRQASPSR